MSFETQTTKLIPFVLFTPPDIPSNETERLAALHDAELLDSGPEIRFDDITRLAARIAEVPISLVSLVDKSRQWFKAKTGIEACETAREISFCGHAVCQPDEVFEIPDASADPRFRDNPLVTGEPRIRFYLGVPLRTEPGIAIGTLCVIDRQPRTLTEEQRALLRALADQVCSLVELRIANLQLREQHERQRELLDQAADLILGLNSPGKVAFANAATERLTGVSASEERTIFDLVVNESHETIRKAMDAVVRSGVARNLPIRFRSAGGKEVRLTGTFSGPKGASGEKPSICAVFRTPPSALVGQGEAVDAESVTCVCGWCQRMRDDQGQWEKIDVYLDRCHGLSTSHGICEDCMNEVLKTAPGNQ